MSESSILNLAIVQTQLFWEDATSNRQHFESLLNEMPTEVDLVLLPEMFSTGFSMNPQNLAEDPEGASFQWMKRMAHKFSTALSASLIIKEGEGYFNRLYFIYPNGEYRIYNKRHLFSLAGEEKVYQAGKERLIVDYMGWRINPQICYDLRFPVWCRNDADIDLQFFVANWPERRAEAWSSLLKARAIENQCFVAGLNRIGNDGNGVYHSGHSAVLDPLGKQISNTEPHQQSVELIKLDKEQVQKVRQKFGFLRDRDQFELI